MISYNAILKQIEKHIGAAQQVGTEQLLREQLSAVRALCDVVLTDEQVAVQPVTGLRMNQISEQPKLVSVSQPVQPMSAQKLQENDANGESIFDF